jgi:hypothetical protein
VRLLPVPETVLGVRRGIGGHQSACAGKEEWLTPPEIIRALGPFDLDPCASIERPWSTAKEHFTVLDNGLKRDWWGRVWMNPPYGQKTRVWLERLVQHGNGIALTFARTETDMFHRFVWSAADAVFFFRGRLHFYHADGRMSVYNAGGPSVLIAYGEENARRIGATGLEGMHIALKRRVLL